MGAGRPQGLRQPGLRQAFDPAEGDGGDGGETRIGDTVTDPRLKVVDHDDMGLFYDEALGIGTASGDGHRTHAIKFGTQDMGEDEGGGGEGELPDGTVAAYGENDAENEFTQLRLKAGTESYAELSLFMESAPDGAPEAALISSERLRIAAFKISLDVDYAAGQYLLSNGERVVTEKIPVVVASTGPGNLATDFAAGNFVDGWGLSVGERILIKDQADDTENGIYIVTPGAPTRADDGRTLEWAHVVALRGTTQARQTFVNINPYIGGFGPGNPINFVTLREFIGAQGYSANLAALAAGITPEGLNLVLTSGVLGQQQALELEPGVDVQAFDQKLAAISGLTAIADRVPYFTGASTAALTALTAFGRSIAGAADAAAVRALLGLSDVASEENAALARAIQVCGFTAPPQQFKFQNLELPGTKDNHWSASGLAGSGSVVRLPTSIAYAMRLSTGTTANQTVQMHHSLAGLFTTAMVPDCAAGRYHLRFYARFPVVPDSTTNIGVGFAKTDASAMLVLGILGGLSTAKFCLNNSPESNTATKSVLSTVSVDTNWHRFDLWADNTAGTVYAAVDGETPVAITGLTWGAAAGPWVHCCNGTTAADQKLDLATSYYAIDGLAA